ncbi:Polyketide cyclase / dehydrase and lipid transport [Amycolatopsis arida]|uniref:Polyketide cyclase / dehydrase and lipid transport n=1 Tax=Amycolatopsis arida TaxID=587909 RepID=A0A1I5V7L9_9PSEU|nr:polyketide cyclase/dehydrase/lipid transport protein [Amycolatopsis arida]SFQ03357.1 Polyketide cyclase / dehydrase and lipid transport [Amycolatopsis arida]
MVAVTVERTIGCAPETFVEFVLDVRRYAEVDDKIGRILWVRRRPGLTEFKFRPRLPGLRLPEPGTVSRMRLVQGNRIDIALAPLPRNALSRFVSRFRAGFTCAPAPGGTTVTRTISFDFNPLVRPLLEPTLRHTLPESVERELRLAEEILGGAEQGARPWAGERSGASLRKDRRIKET